MMVFPSANKVHHQGIQRVLGCITSRDVSKSLTKPVRVTCPAEHTRAARHSVATRRADSGRRGLQSAMWPSQRFAGPRPNCVDDTIHADPRCPTADVTLISVQRDPMVETTDVSIKQNTQNCGSTPLGALDRRCPSSTDGFGLCCVLPRPQGLFLTPVQMLQGGRERGSLSPVHKTSNPTQVPKVEGGWPLPFGFSTGSLPAHTTTVPCPLIRLPGVETSGRLRPRFVVRGWAPKAKTHRGSVGTIHGIPSTCTRGPVEIM